MPCEYCNDDAQFTLPPLKYHMHNVDADAITLDGELFATVAVASTLKERQAAKRESIAQRVEKAASLVPDDRQVVIWCHLNGEAEALAKAIPNSVNLHGGLSDDEKVRIILEFTEGKIQRLITKPSIASQGINWQSCADTIFVGLSDSFEQLFQAVRRFWRFGQTRPVNAHIISATTEGATLANIKRKEADFERMADALVSHTKDLTSRAIKGTAREVAVYNPVKPIELPPFLT